MSSSPIKDRPTSSPDVRPPLAHRDTSYQSAVSSVSGGNAGSEVETDEFVQVSTPEQDSKAASRSTSPAPASPFQGALETPNKKVTFAGVPNFSAPLKPSVHSTAKDESVKSAESTEPTKPTEATEGTKSDKATSADLVKLAPHSTFESLLDACAAAINTVVAAVVALFTFASELATGTAGKVYRGIQTAKAKVKDFYSTTTTTVSNATKKGIQKVKTASAPSTEPAEGRYARAKAWTKAKVHGLCNRALNKLG